MKKNTIKVNGTKYTLNYSPIELISASQDYEDIVSLGEVRTIKSYFSEATLASKELSKENRNFTDLINLFNNKINQFKRLGCTYVFGVKLSSVILHKGSDTVKRTNIQIERDLLSYIIKINKGKKDIYLEFVPGLILKVKGTRTIDVSFDFRENIRNY